MTSTNPYNLPTEWSEVCSGKSVMLGLKKYAFRRDYSSYKMKALGFTGLELVDALDGWEEGVNIDNALKNLGLYLKPNLKFGHKACTYSHIVLWKKMIDEAIPYMTIFEDDCLGHLDLPKGLGQTFWDATPKNFDIVYLGNMMNPADPLLNNPNAIVVQSRSYCMHAYILTLQGAKTLWRLLHETNASNTPLRMLDVQVADWQDERKIISYSWNGTYIQKSYPTYDEGLPWQAFSDVILPQKDTGLFWQNMRLGTTIQSHTLELMVLSDYSNK